MPFHAKGRKLINNLDLLFLYPRILKRCIFWNNNLIVFFSVLSNFVDGLKPVENPPVAVGSDPHVVEYINTVIISKIAKKHFKSHYLIRKPALWITPPLYGGPLNKV